MENRYCVGVANEPSNFETANGRRLPDLPYVPIVKYDKAKLTNVFHANEKKGLKN